MQWPLAGCTLTISVDLRRPAPLSHRGDATMRTHAKRGFRPQLEGIENRCLLSLAVLEIANHSTYNITFDFRWTPSSAWSTYSEALARVGFSGRGTRPLSHRRLSTTRQRPPVRRRLSTSCKDTTSGSGPARRLRQPQNFTSSRILRPGSDSITSLRRQSMQSLRSGTRAPTRLPSTSGGLRPLLDHLLRRAWPG